MKCQFYQVDVFTDTPFGGNPLAMAVGNAVLDIIFGKGFLESVKQKGEYFHQGLSKIKNTQSELFVVGAIGKFPL